MKIRTPLIGMTAIALLGALTVSQAKLNVANPLIITGTLVNNTNGGVIMVGTSRLVPVRPAIAAQNAKEVDPCDLDDRENLPAIKQSQSAVVALAQNKDQTGLPVNFSYTYKDAYSNANTCKVVGSIGLDGHIISLTATATGTLTCRIADQTFISTQRTFYTVVFEGQVSRS